MARLYVVLLLSCVVLGLLPQPAFSQAAREGRLLVTVVDQTGAVIQGATVTLVGLDDNTKKKTFPPVKTSDKGIATIPGLTLGRYSVQGVFTGFDLGLLRDVKIKSGDNRHVMVLPLQRLAEEITVGRDPQSAAADRAGAFGTALTREQVEALSDDPDEMRRQLSEMAGPGASIRVDSFEGQQLPPKSQIKSIHITRDMFAAENHWAGGMFIDIITQPGVGALSGNLGFGFADSALDGRNPLIPKKGPSQNRRLQRQSPRLTAQGAKQLQPVGLLELPVLDARRLRRDARWHARREPQSADAQPELRSLGPGRLCDHQGPDHPSVVHTPADRRRENQGVGAYDLAARAYSTSNSDPGPSGCRRPGPSAGGSSSTRDSRVSVSDSDSQSAVEAPTIVVTDAFTDGGAQRAGGQRSRTFSLQSDLDYVRGIHSWRTGVQLYGGSYRSDDSFNYLGTFSFESLDAYQAGRPRSYTRRIGDPNISYKNLQAGFYVQDDIRVRKSLTLSPGVRFEAQTHLKDYSNVGPRFGVTWAPFKSGKTTLRASAGHLLRLAQLRNLRTDAAGRRIPAAGDHHPRPLVPRSGLGGHRAADQPVPAG